MKFVKLGEDTIRLDLIVRIREGRVDETLYGRNVRKGSDREGWLEVHFVVGEPLKVVGPNAELLRKLLEEEYGVRDLSAVAVESGDGPVAYGHSAALNRPMPPPGTYRATY